MLPYFVTEPYFVQAVDYKDYIYIFFREIAVEYNTMGKVVIRIFLNIIGAISSKSHKLLLLLPGVRFSWYCECLFFCFLGFLFTLTEVFAITFLSVAG